MGLRFAEKITKAVVRGRVPKLVGLIVFYAQCFTKSKYSRLPQLCRNMPETNFRILGCCVCPHIFLNFLVLDLSRRRLPKITTHDNQCCSRCFLGCAPRAFGEKYTHRYIGCPRRPRAAPIQVVNSGKIKA
jgi:hypothetical protein